MASRLRWNPAAIKAAVEAPAERVLDKLAGEIAHEAANSITTPYPPASRPGSPPHLRTGTLHHNVFWGRTGRFKREVGSKTRYALMLEYGTRRMAARPWLRPAIAAVRSRVAGVIGTALAGRATGGVSPQSRGSDPPSRP